VTVFGQSAGAGSVLHQITAYGGLKGPVPFQQAILQSPGFQPLPSNYQQNLLFQQYLAAVNVTTLDEARKLPFQVLQKANFDLVAQSPKGLFTFAPAVDGNFIPALPGQLLAGGGFDKSVKVIAAHNSNETLFFADANATSDADFRTRLQNTFKAIQPSILDYIAEDLYPSVNSTWTAATALDYGYYSNFGRDLVSQAEGSFTCNARWTVQTVSETFPNRRTLICSPFHQDTMVKMYRTPTTMVTTAVMPSISSMGRSRDGCKLI